MGGRFETRADRDPAAREERDGVGAEKPRSSIGRIPGIGVLGEEDEQGAAELGVKRCEDERTDRLRHTRPGRERADEGLEPRAPAQLVDEAGECRGTVGDVGGLVHGSDGERAPQGHRSHVPDGSSHDVPVAS
jgi:hypothetical protein